MSAAPSPAGTNVGGLVARNALYLTVAQVLTIPLAIVFNAVMARYLGAREFGDVYLAGTLVGLVFLVVDWGHQGALPALVARDRSVAGALLGTSVLWRVGLSFLAYPVLALGALLLGYSASLQWAIGLSLLCAVLNSVVAACKDTIRGFERTDIPAYAHVGQQLLGVAVVIVVLALGGRMRAALLATAIAIGPILWWTWRGLRSVGVGPLSYDRHRLRLLLAEGTPFVFFGVAMLLQPNIDAIYLSKLAPAEVMGWYAVTRRLIGVLLLPASALIGALYPTLCRLQATDREGFSKAAGGALRGVALLVVPVALGCGLYPEIGISIFSASFEPAEDNLRILSAFLFLVYFSMPLGTCIMAAGKQKAWSVVQGLCVVVSIVLDPLLVPWFQRRNGNGGMGLCVASLVSEVVVVGAGLILVPPGILGRRLGRSLLLASVSGVAMVLVALATRRWSPFVGAPLSVAAYAVALWLTGGIEKDQMAAIQATIGRRLARFRRTS